MNDPLPTGWAEIHGRLAALQAGLETGFRPAPEEETRLLQARARELARPVHSGSAGETIEVVEFALAGEHYALPVEDVREVGVLKEFTPVPGTPPFIAGIVNLRGEIHTLLDLKQYFDLPASGITELNRVLVLAGEGPRLGLLADAVLGVRTISAAELQSSLPTLTGIRAQYLRGISTERIIVLDAARILGDEALTVRHAAGA